MKRLFYILLFSFSFAITAKSQTHFGINNPQLKTDTITASQLSTIQPDSNIVSFQIQINVIGDPIGKVWNVESNKIPESAEKFIEMLKPGSMVAFEEIIALQNGIAINIPSRNYAIK